MDLLHVEFGQRDSLDLLVVGGEEDRDWITVSVLYFQLGAAQVRRKTKCGILFGCLFVQELFDLRQPI